MITHIVCCNCGHKYEIDELKEGEGREVTCPNCQAKKRIYNMKVGNGLSPDKSEIQWNIKEIFNQKERR
ncbi:MAG: hypothetical protein KGH85_09070 [Thaumarchaeota archaeon]|nr:hypothetical protein [Nitrososphaerota archaeon]